MRNKPIHVTEITYEKPEGAVGNATPLFAEATQDGRKYLVSVSSRTQMTQQVFNAYVKQELDGDELPTITRKAFAYKVVALAPNKRTSNTQELEVRTYQGKTYLMKGGPSDLADALIINPNDPLQLERAQGKYMYVERDGIRCHIKGRDFTITAAQIAADPDLSSLYTKIKTEQDKGPSRGYSGQFLANAVAEPAKNQIGVFRNLQTGDITIKINKNGVVNSAEISANDMLDPQVQELCRSIQSGQLPNITKLLYYTNKQSWTSQVSSAVEKIAIENYELSHGMKGREIAEALTKPSIESNRRELINVALANNLIPGSMTNQLPLAGGLETTELDNLNKAKDYALAKIARGEEFIVPITMSAAGGGHTVYIAGVKEGNNYRTTILNQTEQVPPEALTELQNISKAVTTAINNDLISSGSIVNISQSEKIVINGVFPSVKGGAGCQEVGVILVDAIRNGNLQDVIAHCKDINLGPAKLAEIRLNATLAFEQVQLRAGSSMEQMIDILTYGEVTDAKSRLAIGLGLEPVEIRQPNNLRKDRDDAILMLQNTGEEVTEFNIAREAAIATEDRKESIRAGCLLAVAIPSTPENLAYIKNQAIRNNRVLTTQRVNAAPLVQREQANVLMDNIRQQDLDAPVAGLNVAAMQESIKASLSTAKEIFPLEVAEQLTFVRGAFQSQQPLVNGRVQDLSLAEASDLVAPIIKNQVLEFIAARNSEDAKLLVRALDTAVAKQTFGEQAFNAISQRGMLTELEKASIPGFKPVGRVAPLAPREQAAVRVDNVQAVQRQQDLAAPVAGLNAAVMQESIKEALALSKTISNDVSEQADLIREAFLSQQPIVNRRVQNISQAEASNLVAPIIKNQVLEFIAARNSEDAKLLVRALDTAVAKQTFGEQAFNAISQRGALTELEKASIPGLKPVERVAPLAPREQAAVRVDNVQAVQRQQDLAAPVAGLNVAAMQESIKEALALSKTISNDVSEQADLIREAFLSQQPIVNGRVQNISQAEASNLVAPIIKNQVLEFIAARNSEDAKLLVRALDTAVAKQTFGEVAFNAISQRGALTELEKASIPGFKAVERAAPLEPRAAPINLRMDAPPAVIIGEDVLLERARSLLNSDDLGISEKRTIIKDMFPNPLERGSIVKQLATEAILNGDVKTIRAIDPADLGAKFTEQVNLIRGQVLDDKEREALLGSLRENEVVRAPAVLAPNQERVKQPIIMEAAPVKQTKAEASEIYKNILTGDLGLTKEQGLITLSIDEKRALIKNSIPDEALRESIAKELMTNAILTDDKEMLLTIDPKDLNPVFVEQVKLMEPVELMSSVGLSEERKQALLAALDGAVIVERQPEIDIDIPVEMRRAAAHKEVERELKEEIIANAVETITKSLFGDDYAEKGHRLKDAEIIKEILTLAVQDKALKDFQITDNEENIMTSYIRDNLTEKTALGYFTGGIKLKALTEENKAAVVKDISRAIVKEVQRQKEPPIVLGNLSPNAVPNVKVGGQNKSTRLI